MSQVISWRPLFLLLLLNFVWLSGFGIGAFFSLMSASLAYEDPLLRQQTQAGMNTTQKAGQIFKEMGRGMLSSGKGFGKVGALFAGIECCIEGVRVGILAAYDTSLTIPYNA